MTAKPNPNPSSIPINDPRYPIWGRQYLCRTPRIAHYGTEYLKQYGLPTSGNQAVDRDLMTAMQLSYLTINEQIEIFSKFHIVSIVKKDDVKLIYEACQDYTFDFAERIRNTVYSQNMPFADLIKIDEYAEKVYQYAGHEYGNDFARTFLPSDIMKTVVDLNKMYEAIDKRKENKGKKADKYTVQNAYSPVGMVKEEEKKKDEEKPELPARPSMRDLFLSYMGGDNR